MDANMVKTMINLAEHEDRVLNIVKAKFGLKNKSEAVSLMVREYEAEHLEPELRPEYLERLEKLKDAKRYRFSSMEEFDEIIKNV